MKFPTSVVIDILLTDSMKLESAAFKLCRFSLFLKGPFFQIT